MSVIRRPPPVWTAPGRITITLNDSQQSWLLQSDRTKPKTLKASVLLRLKLMTHRRFSSHTLIVAPRCPCRPPHHLLGVTLFCLLQSEMVQPRWLMIWGVSVRSHRHWWFNPGVLIRKRSLCFLPTLPARMIQSLQRSVRRYTTSDTHTSTATHAQYTLTIYIPALAVIAPSCAR